MVFKVCPNCGARWIRRDDFLSDPDLSLVGYQVHFEELTAGLMLFNHVCRGTLALHAGEFQDLYTGPIFVEKATGSDVCPGYCLHKKDLRPCPAHCECAFFREVIQCIQQWPKKRALQG